MRQLYCASRLAERSDASLFYLAAKTKKCMQLSKLHNSRATIGLFIYDRCNDELGYSDDMQYERRIMFRMASVMIEYAV